MAWGLDAPGTPGRVACACCHAHSLVTRATSHRCADRFHVCPDCDLTPDRLQGPWDGWLARWMAEFPGDVTG